MSGATDQSRKELSKLRWRNTVYSGQTVNKNQISCFEFTSISSSLEKASVSLWA